VERYQVIILIASIFHQVRAPTSLLDRIIIYLGTLEVIKFFVILISGLRWRGCEGSVGRREETGLELTKLI
jgi:hypothetical protein